MDPVQSGAASVAGSEALTLYWTASEHGLTFPAHLGRAPWWECDSRITGREGSPSRVKRQCSRRCLVVLTDEAKQETADSVDKQPPSERVGIVTLE